jgi:hypothetical protein
MARHDAQPRRRFLAATGSIALAGLAGCSGDGDDAATGTTDMMGTDTDMMGTETDIMGTDTDGGMMGVEPMDPSSAPRTTVDRFSEAAGTLFVRGDDGDLPGAGEAIDVDEGPFVTTGYGPDGNVIEYYNFDVQPAAPVPIYEFFREGEDEPVADQLSVVGVVPGDEGYSDFWRVTEVTVPADYTANTVTSESDLLDADYDVTPTDEIVNCPIVPEGSTASKRGGDAGTGLVDGWYEDTLVSYFAFKESSLEVNSGAVPLSPIYVSFNRNPGTDGGGPASGFMTEDGNDRTHNVTATLPDDDDYSPLWMVNVYDNTDFDSVSDLDSATSAEILDTGVATVNCPVVSLP